MLPLVCAQRAGPDVCCCSTAEQDAAVHSDDVTAVEPQGRSELACVLLRQLEAGMAAGQGGIDSWRGQQLDGLALSLLPAFQGQASHDCQSLRCLSSNQASTVPLCPEMSAQQAACDLLTTV